MVVLISGSSHAGKTLLVQKLLEKYKKNQNTVIEWCYIPFNWKEFFENE